MFLHMQQVRRQNWNKIYIIVGASFKTAANEQRCSSPHPLIFNAGLVFSYYNVVCVDHNNFIRYTNAWLSHKAFFFY